MSDDRLPCTSCGTEIPPNLRDRRPLVCPHCGMLVIRDDLDEEVVDNPADERELEEQRIRQIVRGRRALIRVRGYHIAGLLACVVLATQQAIILVRGWATSGWNSQQATHLGLAIALLAGAILLWERVGRLSAELHHKPPPNADPPS